MAEDVVDAELDDGVDGAARLIEELMSDGENAREGVASPEIQAPIGSADEFTADPADEFPPPAGRRLPEPAGEVSPLSFVPPDDARLRQLNQHVPLLARAMLAEFSDLRTEGDLARLGTENPERHNRFLLMRDQLQRAASEQRAAASHNNARWQEAEAKALSEVLPELTDPARAPQMIAELRAFARKNGYTQSLSKASAKDWALLSKAMRFEAASADTARRLENARRRATISPSVQRPGIARDGVREEGLRSDFQRLRKTGYVRDAASVIRQIMN